jgi:hypothetical protein
MSPRIVLPKVADLAGRRRLAETRQSLHARRESLLSLCRTIAAHLESGQTREAGAWLDTLQREIDAEFSSRSSLARIEQLFAEAELYGDEEA